MGRMQEGQTPKPTQEIAQQGQWPVQFSKLLHFVVTYPQTVLMTKNANTMVLKVKKKKKKNCKSNIPCLSELELLENYFIFSRPDFFRLEK